MASKVWASGSVALIDLEVNRLRLLAQDHRALSSLFRLNRTQGVRRRRFRQPPEVLLHDRHDLGCFEVANEGDDHVGGDVVLFVERGRICGGEALQIRRPADDGLTVRMGRKCSCQGLLEETSERTAFRAHAALFVNDFALFVELAEDRVEETLGVEIGPELHAIRRQRVKVRGLVGVREGVHADGAGAVDDLAELVRHYEFLRVVDGGLPRFVERSDLRVVVVDGIAARAVVGGIRLFDFRQRGRLRRVVRRADFVGAFERHVFEHVREAGDPRYFLSRPYVHDRCEREDGGFGALHDDYGQAVVEFARGDALFERGQILRVQGRRDRQKQEE